MVCHSLPHLRITWQMRLRHFIYTFETPLCLRSSIVHLSKTHMYPFSALLCLFVPLPTWHFRVLDPAPFRSSTAYTVSPSVSPRLDAALLWYTKSFLCFYRIGSFLWRPLIGLLKLESLCKLGVRSPGLGKIPSILRDKGQG